VTARSTAASLRRRLQLQRGLDSRQKKGKNVGDLSGGSAKSAIAKRCSGWATCCCSTSPPTTRRRHVARTRRGAARVTGCEVVIYPPTVGSRRSATKRARVRGRQPGVWFGATSPHYEKDGDSGIWPETPTNPTASIQAATRSAREVSLTRNFAGRQRRRADGELRSGRVWGGWNGRSWRVSRRCAIPLDEREWRLRHGRRPGGQHAKYSNTQGRGALRHRGLTS